MPTDTHQLTRRERQIMDIIFARGEATAADVVAALPGEPNLSTVRTLLRIMEEKGHLKHRQDGPRFVYLPVRTRAAESKSALKRVVKTFFGGSYADAIAGLVDAADGKLPPADLKRIEAVIRKAKAR
jgi:BlaI family penicillinase repressor